MLVRLYRVILFKYIEIKNIYNIYHKYMSDMLKRLYKEPNMNQKINYENIKNILEKIHNMTPYEIIVIKNYIVSLPPVIIPNSHIIFGILRYYFDLIKDNIKLLLIPYIIPINEDNVRDIINKMLKMNSMERLIIKEYIKVVIPLPKVDITSHDFKNALILSAELTTELRKIE